MSIGSGITMATTNMSEGATNEAEAQGAQIPMPDFNIPHFPPSARGLRALTLTSAVPVETYHQTLGRPFSIPPLPPAIESLTLELFSLGYPAGFLSQLATRLPNLKSLVVYSQLFGGVSDASNADAVEFFKRLPNLRALHLLDVFAKPGFFRRTGEWLVYNTSDVPGEARRGLMFLEVNYGFRHEDAEFMNRICADELPSMIGPGLVSCSFNISAMDEELDDSSAVGPKEGVMAFEKAASAGLVKVLTDEETSPKGLRALNTTLYTFTQSDLNKVLEVQNHVTLLNVCVETEPGEETKQGFIKALEQCKQLEQVEIMCNPSLQFFMSVQDSGKATMEKSLPSASDLEALSKSCERFSSFKANVLRANMLGTVEWEKKGDKWTGGFSAP